MNGELPAYGLWGLVLINSVVFILFAYSFFKPRDAARLALVQRFQRVLGGVVCRDVWLSADDLFSVRWLQSRFPNIDWFSHDAGHLLEMMFGWKTNPHAGPFHILSFAFIGGGFLLISVAGRSSTTRSSGARSPRAGLTATCGIHNMSASSW